MTRDEQESLADLMCRLRAKVMGEPRAVRPLAALVVAGAITAWLSGATEDADLLDALRRTMEEK